MKKKAKKQNKVTVHLPTFNQATGGTEGGISIKLNQATLDYFNTVKKAMVKASILASVDSLTRPLTAPLIDPTDYLAPDPDFTAPNLDPESLPSPKEPISIELHEVSGHPKKITLEEGSFGVAINGSIIFVVQSKGEFGLFGSCETVTIDHLQAAYNHAVKMGARYIVFNEAGVAQFTKIKPIRVAF